MDLCTTGVSAPEGWASSPVDYTSMHLWHAGGPAPPGPGDQSLGPLWLLLGSKHVVTLTSRCSAGREDWPDAGRAGFYSALEDGFAASRLRRQRPPVHYTSMHLWTAGVPAPVDGVRTVLVSWGCWPAARTPSPWGPERWEPGRGPMLGSEGWTVRRARRHRSPVDYTSMHLWGAGAPAPPGPGDQCLGPL